MTKEKTIAVAGHLCLDITPVFPKGGKTRSLADILVPGRLIQMEHLEMHTGGVVANTGLALKKMGVDTICMGKIGNDQLGEIIRGIMESYGADKGLIQADDCATSYTIALAPPGSDRIFLHNPGANDAFGLGDLDMAAVAGSDLFHFGYPPVMALTYQNDGQGLVEMFAAVQKAGVATSLDMSMVDDESPAGKADWLEIIKRVLPHTDLFLPSIEELGYMLDRPLYESWLTRAKGQDVTRFLSVEQDIKPLAGRLLEMGAKVVLIKCGAPGLYYKTAGEEKMAPLCKRFSLEPGDWCNKEGFEQSYKPSRVLSGTGAGDTTIAAFLAAITKGYPLSRCIALAAAQGASCVSAYDALGGLETLEELERKIDSGWEKQSLLQ